MSDKVLYDLYPVVVLHEVSVEYDRGFISLMITIRSSKKLCLLTKTVSGVSGVSSINLFYHCAWVG